MKIFLWKKDAFDCARIRAKVFRLQRFIIFNLNNPGFFQKNNWRTRKSPTRGRFSSRSLFVCLVELWIFNLNFITYNYTRREIRVKNYQNEWERLIISRNFSFFRIIWSTFSVLLHLVPSVKLEITIFMITNCFITIYIILIKVNQNLHNLHS